jgi:hypothetical protein
MATWTEMPRSPGHAFYDRLQELLREADFDGFVEEACGRRGRNNVERLMVQHGDAKLTELLDTLAHGPKARSVSVHDRCRAVYEGL